MCGKKKACADVRCLVGPVLTVRTHAGRSPAGTYLYEEGKLPPKLYQSKKGAIASIHPEEGSDCPRKRRFLPGSLPPGKEGACDTSRNVTREKDLAMHRPRKKALTGSDHGQPYQKRGGRLASVIEGKENMRTEEETTRGELIPLPEGRRVGLRADGSVGKSGGTEEPSLSGSCSKPLFAVGGGVP